MKTTTLFILLLTIVSVQAQETISGKILDNKDTPLAYANVYIPDTQVGALTQLNGSFNITIPDSLSQSVLEIVYLGYVKKSFRINELNDNINEIILEPLDMNLAEVVVKPKRFETIHVGEKEEKYDTGIGRSFRKWNHIFRMALFVPNNRGEVGFIESASFFVVKNFHVKKGHKTPFRLRVYDVNEEGEPGDDLLLVNLISQAKKKNKWHRIDLSEYKIPIPEKGFFVAMEWLYSEDKAYQKEVKVSVTDRDGTTTEEKRTFYGQILGLVKTDETKENTTTWQSKGDEWTKGFCFEDDPSSNYKGHCSNAMISVGLKVGK